jgi:MFS-type transporter involved in bile tolerance (Atg22 family)
LGATAVNVAAASWSTATGVATKWGFFESDVTVRAAWGASEEIAVLVGMLMAEGLGSWVEVGNRVIGGFAVKVSILFGIGVLSARVPAPKSDVAQPPP